jgi:type IV secretion system protein VirD4
MRWPKVAVLVCCLLLTIYILYYAWPLIGPIIESHPRNYNDFVYRVLDSLITPLQGMNGLRSDVWFVVFGLGGLMYALISYDLKHRPSTTHGSAHPASRREARPYRAPYKLPALPNVRRPGRTLQKFTTLWRGRAARHAFFLRLGKYHGQDIALSEEQQYRHLLLTGPTGGGKSARFFVPNLLREMGTRSLFIADLKNELYKICAGWLSQHMQIWLFAPLQPTISAGYNPLAHIRGVEDAQDFAEAWVVNTGVSQKESFWDTNSRLLISAMALHLVETEENPPFSRLADMLCNRSYEEIRDTLRGSPSYGARYIAGQFLEHMEKNERLVGSQMADTSNRFQLLASPQARAITTTNTIDFEEMISTPTAFFLSIPRPATKRYRPLLAVLTQQMFAAWERSGTQGMGCYLDEFANLGHIPGYAEFISTARALKVAVFMAVQNFSQLNERYSKNDADTIKANAVTHLLLPGAGLEECKYYSERIGDTTVPTWTVNRRGSGLSEEVTSSESETRRRVFTPDELRTMQPDQMLMLEASSAPLMLITKLFFHDSELARRANLPYTVTQIQQQPTSPASSYSQSQGLPPAPQPTGPQVPPIVIDGDLDKEEDDDGEGDDFIMQ